MVLLNDDDIYQYTMTRKKKKMIPSFNKSASQICRNIFFTFVSYSTFCCTIFLCETEEELTRWARQKTCAVRCRVCDLVQPLSANDAEIAGNVCAVPTMSIG